MLDERVCKACFNTIKTSPFRHFIEKDVFLCDGCLKKIKVHIHYRKHKDIPVFFLSNYDGILKEWLFRYKEQKDIELAPCFLFNFKLLLKLLFHDYIFLPLPSSKVKIDERGFLHLEEMLKRTSLKYTTIFNKTILKEQKEMGRTDRYKDNRIILRDNADELNGKKVVLFDDVFTTGSTFNSAFEALKTIPVKKIKGVILLDNYSIEERKLN